MPASTLKIRPMALSKFKEAARNPRGHDLDALILSFEMGFNDPVAINETTGRLVEGHGRVLALAHMKNQGMDPPQHVYRNAKGEWMVPTLRGLKFENEAQAERYLMAHNRLVERGTWEDDMLADMLSDQRDAYDAVLGWTDSQVDDIVLSAGDDPVVVGGGQENYLDDKLDRFVNADLKQTVFYFKADEYASIIALLDTAMKKAGVDNHSSAVLAALEAYAR